MASSSKTNMVGVLGHMAAVRVLSIDGGGIRGIIPLKVLLGLKQKTGKEPHELFDVICGTSTGGILAILLGVLKLKLEDVLKFYETLGQEIFPKESMITKLLRLLISKETYSSRKLENLIKSVIQQSGYDPEEFMNSQRLLATVDDRPYVFAVSTHEDEPYLFRNYAGTSDNEKCGTNKVKIWEAARATSAATTYFLPMEINGGLYVDGGVGNNNPSLVALQELKRIHALADRFPIILVSLGTGLNPSSPSKAGMVGAVTDVVDVVTETEKTHEEINLMATDNDYLLYWRLNPSLSTTIGLDDASAEMQLETIADAYLKEQETQRLLDEIIEATQEKPLPPGNDIGCAVRLKFHGIAQQFRLKYDERLVSQDHLYITLADETQKAQVQAVVLLNSAGTDNIGEKLDRISAVLK